MPQTKPGDDDGERDRLLAAVNARLATPPPHRPGHVPAGPREPASPGPDWVRRSARQTWPLNHRTA